MMLLSTGCVVQLNERPTLQGLCKIDDRPGQKCVTNVSQNSSI